MHNIEIILGLLLVVAVLAVVAERLVVPYPIMLVLGGLVLGFIPGLPKVDIDPELVFLVFCACCDAMDEGSQEQLAAFEYLQHEVLVAERKILIKLRKQGIINDEVLLRIEREIDLDEVRLGG